MSYKTNVAAKAGRKLDQGVILLLLRRGIAPELVGYLHRGAGE